MPPVTVREGSSMRVPSFFCLLLFPTTIASLSPFTDLSSARLGPRLNSRSLRALANFSKVILSLLLPAREYESFQYMYVCVSRMSAVLVNMHIPRVVIMVVIGHGDSSVLDLRTDCCYILLYNRSVIFSSGFLLVAPHFI